MAARPWLLTTAEIQVFKRDGYFIRRGLLAPELTLRCRDAMWESGHFPERFVRGDRSTYIGPYWEGEPGVAGGHRSTARRDVLSDHEDFVELLPQNPKVKDILEQLLGEGEVEHQTGETGGVVSTLPMGGPEPRAKTRNYGHVDSSLDSRDRLSCAAYIDDVAPGGGGFMVWPGSHRKTFAFLTTSKACRRNGYGKPNSEKKNLSGGPDRAPTYAAGMFREDGQGASEWSNKNIVPVDAWGPAGTVVFYHSRLMHERGPNYSDNIRQAVLMRFGKTAESLPEEECIEHARTGEIWRDWSAIVRETPTAGGERPEDWTALTKGASVTLIMCRCRTTDLSDL